MKQRYVYIIRRGETIRAVETNRRNALARYGELKGKDPERPTLGDGDDAMEQWIADMQRWDYEWHMTRHPIGPPIETPHKPTPPTT